MRRRAVMRKALVGLTLVGHLIAAFGCPVPTPRVKGATAPYRCQDRPCGCLSAEACWAGDCCCFTLEQKLAWADDRGIEPPAHVRPLVESRKKLTGEDKPCCCEGGEAPPCCPEPAPAPVPSVRWVVGVFAQKCANASPAAFESEPSVPAEPAARPVAPERRGVVAAEGSVATLVPHVPPSPPPRP